MTNLNDKIYESSRPYIFHSSKYTVYSHIDFSKDSFVNKESNDIHLRDVASAWGNGAHPTTKLCVDFLEQDGIISRGSTVLDYGTGSGILSIIAAKLGASECIAVDIDDYAIEVANTNAKLNHCEKTIRVMHTREVTPGDSSLPTADVTIANIQPGPLSRLVAALWMFTKPGGWLCLSGMRPTELQDIRRYSMLRYCKR